MYAQAIIDRGYEYSASDTYFVNVLDPYGSVADEKLLAWCQRQVGTVAEQLAAGSRFLDIRLEYSAGAFYAHHGVLGASLSEVCKHALHLLLM